MHFPRIDCFQDHTGDYEEAAAAAAHTAERASVTKPRCLALTFTTTSFISDHQPVIFTGIPLDEQGLSLELSLIDAANRNHVVVHGPGSSAAVEIIVLPKDFNFNGTFEDYFNSRVVGADTPRLGISSFSLKDGIASVSQTFFKHTNKHTTVKELRLGARIVHGFIDAPEREATSQPFTLKDRRNMSKKHYPPCLDDEVWRLENIARNGPFHQRLRGNNINTVGNFLTELDKDPGNLRNILVMTRTPKIWEKTVKHARSCAVLSGTVSQMQPEYGGIPSQDHLDQFWYDPNYLPHQFWNDPNYLEHEYWW